MIVTWSVLGVTLLDRSQAPWVLDGCVRTALDRDGQLAALGWELERHALIADRSVLVLMLATGAPLFVNKCMKI